MRKKRTEYIRKRTGSFSAAGLLATFIILIWLALLPGLCLGAEYYVDQNHPQASDANPGTADLPWATLGRTYTWYGGAEEPKVQEGDTVIFRDGNYGEFREHTNDGSQYLFYRNNWTTYKADLGHTPILNRISVQNADKWGGSGDGSSYLIFDGLRILEGISLQHTSYVQVRNCNITTKTAPYEGLHAPYVYPGAEGIHVINSHYITIENNDISYVYRGIGATDGTENVVIRDNVIHRIGEDGIISTVTQILVENNTIFDLHKYRTTVNIYGTKVGDFIEGEKVVLQGTGAEGIFYRYTPRIGYDIIEVWQTTEVEFKEEWRDGRGTTIIGQTNGATLSITNVDPAHTDGITIQAGVDIIVRGNNITRRYGGGDDGQGLKLDRPKNITVENNLIDSTKPVIMGGTDNCNFYNNTLYGIDGMELYTDLPTIINIMYNNIIERLVIRGDTANGYGWIINHGNNIFGPGKKPHGFGGPSYPFAFNESETVIQDLDSLFVDVAGGDFRLAEGSVAIDFGDPAYAPLTDINGNPRDDGAPDAGCYEYIASTFIYGDVNGNGEVTSYDAALVARYAVGLEVFTDEQRQKADVSGNGAVSAYDAALIAQKAVGLIERFPVEE